jgi:hypothetical protein
MEELAPSVSWQVSPGRGRPTASWWALVLWVGIGSWLVLWSGPIGALLAALVGVYVVGPLWVPVTYRVDELGVCRKTPFGSRLHPWEELGSFSIDVPGHTAWIARKGRGTARFLPPLLLLWEETASPAFRERLATALAARLPTRTA